MSDDGEETMDWVEAIAVMLKLAQGTREYYEGLIEAGWTQEEAWKLTLAWQHAMSGGKAPEL